MEPPTETTEEHTSTSMTKSCSACLRELPRSRFHKDKQNPDGLCGRCIECRAHERRLARYDLTPQQYKRMLFMQNYQCAICHRPLPELEHGLAVDHDHVTGKVRGLLCLNCNTGLGQFADDVVRMHRALEYVKLWKEEHDSQQGV